MLTIALLITVLLMITLPLITFANIIGILLSKI